MRRGEVWWAVLPRPAGRRPVLLLSRDSMPAGRGEVTVAYLTTTFRHLLVEVPLAPADGVPMPWVVNLDSINTVPKRALRRLICTLSPAKMAKVKAAIVEALDLH
jgi:mRNA-degrading endonuclease toxin of MazEF toxin-antitoxin module